MKSLMMMFFSVSALAAPNGEPTNLAIIQIADDAPAPCTSSTDGAPARRSPRSA